MLKERRLIAEQVAQQLFAAEAAIDAAKKDIAPLTNATTEYDKSIEDVQKITHDSKDDVERNYRARIDEMQLNIDGLGKERDTLRSRLEQAERIPDVQFELARAYSAKKDNAKAMEALKRAVEANP